MIDLGLKRYVGLIKLYIFMLAVVSVPDIFMSIMSNKNQEISMVQCGLLTLLCVLSVYAEKSKLDVNKIQIILAVATVIVFSGSYIVVVRQLFVMGISLIFSLLTFPIVIIAWIICYKYNRSTRKGTTQGTTVTQTSIISTIAAASFLFGRKYIVDSSPEKFACIWMIGTILLMLMMVWFYSFVVVKIKNIEEENKDY